MSRPDIADQETDRTFWEAIQHHLKIHKRAYVTAAILFPAAILLYILSRVPALSLEHEAENMAKAIAGGPTRQPATPIQIRDMFLTELETARNLRFWREFLFHLALAFAVSIIVILSVEISTAANIRKEVNEYRRLIAEGVWKAVTGRMLSSQIVQELDLILKSKVVREECRYTLALRSPYRDLPQGYLILERKLRYKLRNVTGGELKHKVRSHILTTVDDISVTDADGLRAAVPRHTCLKIGKVEKKLSDVLKKDKQGRERILEHEVTLSRGGEPVEVYMCSEEPVRLRDKSNFTSVTPMTGLTVILDCSEVRSRVKDVEIRLNHPNWQEFVETSDGYHVYEGGILPGQSFTLSWAEREDEKGNPNCATALPGDAPRG